jgi:hypothetical protein
MANAMFTLPNLTPLSSELEIFSIKGGFPSVPVSVMLAMQLERRWLLFLRLLIDRHTWRLGVADSREGPTAN